MQADSAEAPTVAPLAEQPRSPDSFLPIAFSFAAGQLLPRALAGTAAHRTTAPAVIATRAGKRSIRSIVHVSPSLGRRGVTRPRIHIPSRLPSRQLKNECWVSKDTAHRRSETASYGQHVPPFGQQKVSTSETQSAVHPDDGLQQLESWAQTTATQGSLQPVRHSA